MGCPKKHGSKRGVECNKKDGVEHGVLYHSIRWGKTWGCIQFDYGVNYGVEKHGVIIFYRL